MTIQALAYAALIPPAVEANQQTTAITTTMPQTVMTFDGTADRLALVTWIPKTGTLTAVEFRTGVVSTAGATFQIQVEGVDGSGNPSGSALVANANGTVVVGTGDDNVWKSVPINGGAGVSVTKGQLCAIVLTVSSGTPNTVIIAGAPSGWSGAFIYGDMPYLVQDTGGGSWARLGSSSISLCLAFDYGGTYEMVLGGHPLNALALTTIGNGAESALVFTAPWKMRVAGLRARLCNIAAGGDFRVRLYGSDGTTVLAESISSSVNIDGDVVLGATNDNYYDVWFPESPTLSAGVKYYAAVLQQTANAVPLAEVSVASAGYMAAMPCGTGFFKGSRATSGSGAWTESTTIRPAISLWVDGFDDGAGSGGDISQPYVMTNAGNRSMSY